MEPAPRVNGHEFVGSSSRENSSDEVPLPGNGWHERYILAVKRYETLDLNSPEAYREATEGLRGWVALLPLYNHRRTGNPAPANKWGLGAERCLIRGLTSCLVERGEPQLADRVRSEMADLIATVEALDGYCMATEPDPQAIERLIGTIRIQVKTLGHLLRQIAARGRKTDSGQPRARLVRKRTAPDTSEEDSRLMREWERVRGKAGMTRGEFCGRKGISMNAFIRAQDRHRKRRQSER